MARALPVARLGGGVGFACLVAGMGGEVSGVV